MNLKIKLRLIYHSLVKLLKIKIKGSIPLTKMVNSFSNKEERFNSKTNELSNEQINKICKHFNLDSEKGKKV